MVLTAAAVLGAFRTDEPTSGLLLALEAIHDLGTEGGRLAILGAMADRRVSPGWIEDGWGERELAVHLFLGQHDAAPLNDVYARALVQVHEDGRQRTYNEFVASSAGPIKSLKERTERLRVHVLTYCKEHGLGTHAQVQSYEDDGVYVFQVVHSHHLQKPLAVPPDSDERTMIAFRPVHSDIVRYDAMTGRLRISARAATLVDFLRVAFGAALFDDASFFTNRPTCTLDPLHKGQRALDAHDRPGVGRVRLTECAWEFPNGDVHRLRSADCFAALEERGLAFENAEIIEAKLKISMAGPSTRPVTVTVRIPSRLKISGGQRHVEEVHKYLDAIGVRRLQSEQDHEADLWGLAGGPQAFHRWQRVFGGRTDALVNAGVLRRVRRVAIQAEEHPGAGLAHEAIELEGGGFYGVSDVPEIPSRSLSETDVEALELQPEVYRTCLRAELALDGPAQPWAGGPLLDLGRLAVAEHAIRVFYAITPLPGDAAATLRSMAPGAHAVVLVPWGRRAGAVGVPMETPFPTRRALERVVLVASGLDEDVPATHIAPEGARLVVDARLGRVWVDGVAIEELKPETTAYKLVLALARRCPNPVPTTDLTEEIAGEARLLKDGTTAARQAKAEAKGKIIEALAAAGRSLDEFHAGDPFTSPEKGTYRCALRAYVREATPRAAGT